MRTMRPPCETNALVLCGIEQGRPVQSHLYCRHNVSTSRFSLRLTARQAAQRQPDAVQRRQLAALARAERDLARQSRRATTLNKQLQREAERDHVRQQEQEVESLNSDLDQQVQGLIGLLQTGLTAARPLDFEA
jgi:hypothetical protein